MLLDGRLLPPATCLRSKICIIGTGMGALSVARNLVAAGLDVVLIEAGPVTATGRAAPAIDFEEVGQPFRLSRSRGLEIGGGTGFWHGICAQLDKIDFEQREWIPHSGWPIGDAELSVPYRQAWDFLCGGDRAAFAQAAAGLAQQLVPNDILQHKAYQFRTSPFRGKDMVLAWCQKGRVRCVTHAAALQLSVDEAGTARELTAGSGDRLFRVQADIFIIAAGALETPRLLLNSHRQAGQGWAKSLWWLGRNLIDHPAAYLSQVEFQRPIPAPFFSGFEAGGGVKILPGLIIKPGIQHAHQLPNHTLFIRAGHPKRKPSNRTLTSFLGVRGVRDLRLAHLRALLTDGYVRWRIAHQRLQLGNSICHGDLFFMTEQLPNPASRIDLSKRKRDQYGYPVARVNWRLSRDDVERFGRTLDLVMASLERHSEVRGLRKDDIADWLGSVSSAAHHLGTARMATSPAAGVVDANLKIFGVNNVWISDGSVFPTAGSVNPSLTICALGHRLADHLLSTALRPLIMQGSAQSRTPEMSES